MIQEEIKNLTKKITFVCRLHDDSERPYYEKELYYEANGLDYANEFSRISIGYHRDADKANELKGILTRMFPELSIYVNKDDSGDYNWYSVYIDVDETNVYTIDMDEEQLELLYHLNK